MPASKWGAPGEFRSGRGKVVGREGEKEKGRGKREKEM